MAQTAIFGKINPVISIVEQTTLFNPSPTYITGSYITAVANPYVLGTNSVNFRVSYGNCEFDDNGEVTSFKTVHSDNVVLSGSDITSWGEDDSVILIDIATQQGTTVTQVVSGSLNNGRMMF
jgi:hypothetical protein